MRELMYLLFVLAFDHELKALGEPDRWKSATSAAVIGNGNTAASAVAACTVMLKNGQTNKRITVAARHPGKNRQLPDIIGEGDAIACEEKTIDASADTLRDADIVISTIPGHAADAVAATHRGLNWAAASFALVTAVAGFQLATLHDGRGLGLAAATAIVVALRTRVLPLAPHIFASAGPRCLVGPCPEGRMCCGKQTEVRAKYAKLKEEAV